MRISRTALTCLLRLKAYGTYPSGLRFEVDGWRDISRYCIAMPLCLDSKNLASFLRKAKLTVDDFCSDGAIDIRAAFRAAPLL